jgi:hypothetical protein
MEKDIDSNRCSESTTGSPQVKLVTGYYFLVGEAWRQHHKGKEDVAAALLKQAGLNPENLGFSDQTTA